MKDELSFPTEQTGEKTGLITTSFHWHNATIVIAWHYYLDQLNLWNYDSELQLKTQFKKLLLANLHHSSSSSYGEVNFFKMRLASINVDNVEIVALQ